jgi:cytochrome c-type biogenesis protein CcmH
MQEVNRMRGLLPPLIHEGLRGLKVLKGIFNRVKSPLPPLFQRGGIIRQLCVGIAVLLVCTKTFAAIDPYEFDNESQRERYQHFIEDMRCPKCQNQNLAGSDAPIAQDLRHELQRLLKEGKSDRDITDYMVSRYGDFILYDPPFDKRTAALWLAPIVFVVVGIAVLIGIARRRVTSAATAELTAEEQIKLAQILDSQARDSGAKSS